MTAYLNFSKRILSGEIKTIYTILGQSEKFCRLMEMHEISTRLLEFVQNDAVYGARLLVAGVEDRDRKSIVAKRGDRDPPLFVATLQGNVDMVEFLVKECHADTEERGRYGDPNHLVTPLWCAAISEELEVLKVLINLGADINAACHGADIKKPNNIGTTCLMQAIWNKEICQILIDNGAEVNAQDSSGNTALHWAIEFLTKDYPGKEDIVQLLVDHGSDPLIKNKDGNDAFVTAIFASGDSILNKLLLKIEPPVKRKIEFYELLGALHFHRSSIDIERVVAFWKKAIEMRRMHSCYDFKALQPNPVYLFAREVKTVEELETLSQNHDLLCMHALMLSERILGPGHLKVRSGLLMQATTYAEKSEFRRCIDIEKYAYKLQNTFAEQLTNPFCVPYSLKSVCWRFCEAHSNNYCQIEVEEVIEVLRMATSNVDSVTGIAPSQEFQIDESLTFMVLILQLIKLITELDKNEVQLLSFKKIVRRLIRTDPETKRGLTFLHLSVKQSTSKVDGIFFLQFPCIAVVELLIKCGANVNAVDDENNTVLHLCSKALRNLEMIPYHHLLTRIAVILLKNNAHVDMINRSGYSAECLATSLTNIKDYVNLKCLAAGAILKFRIRYAGYLPASLESFVKMHGPPNFSLASRWMDINIPD